MSEFHDKIDQLIGRMLTCAHAIDAVRITGNPWDTTCIAEDARTLLIEAAEMLKSFQPAQEPMEIIPPPPKDFAIDRSPLSDYRKMAEQINKTPNSPYWTDPGPPVTPREPNPRACPKCGSHTQKIVHRVQGHTFDLECPVCRHRWLWGTTGKWV
jgi:hypothetical protein